MENTVEQDSDYDGAWKDSFRTHLQEITGKFFPHEHGEIDWTVPPVWHDKEISQVLGQSGSRNRRVDMLVEVRLLNGDTLWILVHLEVQASYEPEFAERVSEYNAGLRWTFRRRVLSLVILADLRPNWRPNEDAFQLGGFESRLKFPVCKLIDHLDSDWKDDHSLPVFLARAQIEALRTAGDPDARYRAKWAMVRGLYALGYNAERVRELFRIIDWMMHLRPDLEIQFRRDLSEFEEAQKMPYVTSVERLAREEGLAEGKAEGKAEGEVVVILELLEAVCGEIPDDLQQSVRELESSQRRRLGKALLQFKTLSDLQSWLADAGN